VKPAEEAPSGRAGQQRWNCRLEQGTTAEGVVIGKWLSLGDTAHNSTAVRTRGLDTGPLHRRWELQLEWTAVRGATQLMHLHG
jgi:hypothetical protein